MFLLPLLLTLPPAAYPMIAVAMVLGIVMVGIWFAIAYAMQNPQMVAVAREELAALIFSAFIIGFWLGSDALLNSVVGGMVVSTLPPDLQSFSTAGGEIGGLTGSHLNLALASLKIMEEKLKDQYKDLYLFEALIGFLSTISFPLGSPVPAVNVISFSMAPFTGLTLLSNAHTVVVEAIGYLISLLWGKEFILIFCRDCVPILLFPLGLVLRAIPVFRRTGSSVIAIAFAMYFAFPFALIFSNYLIFDLFRPADFTYTPAVASLIGDRDKGFFEQIIGFQEGPESQAMLGQFTSKSAVSESSDDPGDPCVGNFVIRSICSTKNIISSGLEQAAGFLSTVWNIWRFMVGMTGDFFSTLWTSPLSPASSSAGLYFFLIKEVMTIAPFIILVMFTTVLEIIITITAYRSVSLVIGGEAELVGITKVI